MPVTAVVLCSSNVATISKDSVNLFFLLPFNFTDSFLVFPFFLGILEHHGSTKMSAEIPILILGLGWTGHFLINLLSELHIGYAATTRHQTNDTIQWELPQDNSSYTHVDVSNLPRAQTILITFPVLSQACMTALINSYESKYGGEKQWILLSSTRPFSGSPSDRHGPIDSSKDTSGRMNGECVILKRGGAVLHLSGLWGAQR